MLLALSAGPAVNSAGSTGASGAADGSAGSTRATEVADGSAGSTGAGRVRGDANLDGAAIGLAVVASPSVPQAN